MPPLAEQSVQSAATGSREPHQTTMTTLPDELLLQILRHLPEIDLTTRIPLVSRRFRNCSDEVLRNYVLANIRLCREQGQYRFSYRFSRIKRTLEGKLVIFSEYHFAPTTRKWNGYWWHLKYGSAKYGIELRFEPSYPSLSKLCDIKPAGKEDGRGFTRPPRPRVTKYSIRLAQIAAQFWRFEYP